MKCYYDGNFYLNINFLISKFIIYKIMPLFNQYINDENDEEIVGYEDKTKKIQLMILKMQLMLMLKII